MENGTVAKKVVRGRPRGFDIEGALASAQALFHAKGYDALGVAELGQALGINPPSLYAAFGSKAGLFARVVARYEAENGGVLASALAQEGTAAAAITAMLDAAARLYTRSAACGGCLVLENVRTHSDPDARALAERGREALREAIAARVAKDRPESARKIADLAVIALTGMSAAAREGADAARLRAFGRIVAEGIRKDLGRWP